MRHPYPKHLTALLVLTLGPLVVAAAERSGDVLDCVIGPHESVEVSSAVPGLIEKVVAEGFEQLALSRMQEFLPGACPDCGSQLEFAEGCVTCKVCGYSECG